MMGPLKYTLTPAQFNAKAAALSVATGQAITSHNGTLSHSGVMVQYDYDGSAQLTVTVLKKPFVVTENYITGKLNDWFKA